MGLWSKQLAKKLNNASAKNKAKARKNEERTLRDINNAQPVRIIKPPE